MSSISPLVRDEAITGTCACSFDADAARVSVTGAAGNSRSKNPFAIAAEVGASISFNTLPITAASYCNGALWLDQSGPRDAGKDQRPRCLELDPDPKRAESRPCACRTLLRGPAATTVLMPSFCRFWPVVPSCVSPKRLSLNGIETKNPGWMVTEGCDSNRLSRPSWSASRCGSRPPVRNIIVMGCASPVI